MDINVYMDYRLILNQFHKEDILAVKRNSDEEKNSFTHDGMNEMNPIKKCIKNELIKKDVLLVNKNSDQEQKPFTHVHKKEMNPIQNSVKNRLYKEV